MEVRRRAANQKGGGLKKEELKRPASNLAATLGSLKAGNC